MGFFWESLGATAAVVVLGIWNVVVSCLLDMRLRPERDCIDERYDPYFFSKAF